MARQKELTRAQMFGIRPRMMAERTKRQLAKLREKAAAAVEPWFDFDGSMQAVADDLDRAFDALMAYVDGSVEYLNERPEL